MNAKQLIAATFAALLVVGAAAPASVAAADDEAFSRAAYNAGNTAFTVEDGQRALAFYRRALLADPANDDARFNYEFVKRQLDEQGQQQDQQNQQDQNEPPPEPSAYALALKERADALVGQRRYRDAHRLMAAGQRTDSPYQFKYVSYWGAVPYVTQGYAVIDDDGALAGEVLAHLLACAGDDGGAEAVPGGLSGDLLRPGPGDLDAVCGGSQLRPLDLEERPGLLAGIEYDATLCHGGGAGAGPAPPDGEGLGADRVALNGETEGALVDDGGLPSGVAGSECEECDGYGQASDVASNHVGSSVAGLRSRVPRASVHVRAGTGPSEGVGSLVGLPEDGAPDGVEDPEVQEASLLGRCEGGPSDAAGAAGGWCGHAAATVAADLVGGQLEVACAIHPDEVGVEVEHEGGLGLAGVLGLLLPVEEVVNGDVPEVEDAYPGGRGDERGQRLEVGVVAVTGDEDELGYAVGLPCVQELVDGPVQGLAAEGGGAGVGALGPDVDAEAEGGGSKHAELL